MIIVDYGMGNTGSIINMLKKVGSFAEVSRDPQKIKKANKIILPGVGNFSKAMSNIHNLGLYDLLNEKVSEGVPILGICLGMQIMTKSSEEGNSRGFGWVDANVKKFVFPKELKLKVPHIGWNYVKDDESNSFRLFEGLGEEKRFYFVHSYYVKSNTANLTKGITHFGHDFTSAFQYKNIYGVQFHPEKSHKFGMQLFINFSKL